MLNGTIIPNVPAAPVLDERVGRWVGLFDRMTDKSLAVIKAINIAPLCPSRRDGSALVRLEYTESGDGVSVVFRDNTPQRGTWSCFSTLLSKINEEEKHRSFVYCAEQLGLSSEELSQMIIANAPNPSGAMAVLVVPQYIGAHQDVRDSGRDINGGIMLNCRTCGVFTHSYDDPFEDLRKTACNPDCRNCKALRDSGETQPAVPVNGTCHNRLHVCPNDGNRWWQTNDHYHMWSQITSDSEWNNLCRPQAWSD